MSTYDLNIVWLYPDILNLHGDRGNVMALMTVARQLGLEPHLTRVDHLTDPVDLNAADLVVIGGGELAVMPAVIEALRPLTNQLQEYVAAGKGIYVSGTSVAIVAGDVRRLGEPDFVGLGLINATVCERETIYGDDLILKVPATHSAAGNRPVHAQPTTQQELGGVQIRMVNLYPQGSETPFGQLVYGLGNNQPQSTAEGIRHQNLIATNLLGPALVKNPWFTASYIRDLMAVKYPGVVFPDPQPEPWQFERRGAEAVRRFTTTKRTLSGVIQ